MPTKGARRRAAKRIPLTPLARAQRVAVTGEAAVSQLEPSAQPTDMRRLFYLVQRLELPGKPPGLGFDRYFRLEYMGAAEFETGAVGDSLRRMRAAGCRDLEINLTKDGVTKDVYVVGASEGFEEKIEAFREWFATPGRLPGNEWTNFDTLFFGTQRKLPTVAWWALEADLAWSLDRSIAERLYDAFQP